MTRKKRISIAKLERRIKNIVCLLLLYIANLSIPWCDGDETAAMLLGFLAIAGILTD